MFWLVSNRLEAMYASNPPMRIVDHPRVLINHLIWALHNCNGPGICLVRVDVEKAVEAPFRPRLGEVRGPDSQVADSSAKDIRWTGAVQIDGHPVEAEIESCVP